MVGIMVFSVALLKFTYIITIEKITCKINLGNLIYGLHEKMYIKKGYKKNDKTNKKTCNLFHVLDVFINESTNDKGKKMKKISRKEAETLIQAENILGSNVVQDQDEMRVLLTLSNDQTFLLRYDLHLHDKTYYLT